MPAFPSTLPSPTRSGYTVSPEQAFVRTDFESGFARQRQRYTDAPERMNVTWRFKPAEMDTFMQFFRGDIHHGTDFFTIDLNIGDGIKTVDARFTAPYEAMLLPGNNWEVQGQIEVREIAEI